MKDKIEEIEDEKAREKEEIIEKFEARIEEEMKFIREMINCMQDVQVTKDELKSILADFKIPSPVK